MHDREFDIVVYGATGFTGRLVAEYLNPRHAGSGLRWAIGGRSANKLALVRDELGLASDTALIVADSADREALGALATRARVVLTTVGPYQLYGSELVAACAEAGTDYVDLCGETAWMRAMIDAHDARAKGSGARILFSCGFDSIPCDLGVLTLQQFSRAETGVPLTRVMGRARKFAGGFSGGTLASLRANLLSAADPEVAATLADPFSLTPGFRGPRQPTGSEVAYDEALDAWLSPFVMAAINTRNIHRSNFLLDFSYGEGFTYDEMVVTGPGAEGEAAARGLMTMMAGVGGVGGPKPGEGPSLAEREAGYYDLLFYGLAPDGSRLECVVTGDRDPGYGSTSKMISEAAISLLHDAEDLPGGIWTPGAALGEKLVARLRANAGLTFEVGRA